MSQKPLPPDLLRALTIAKAPGNDQARRRATGAQIARLAKLTGEPLFSETASGRALTDVGEFVLNLARQMLAANDRLLAVGDRSDVRLGVNSMLLDFVIGLSSPQIKSLAVISDTCSTIVKAFDARAIDIAMILDVKDHRAALGSSIVAEFEIDFAWVCTREFVFSPEMPIPLALWPADQFIFLDILSRQGITYRPMFTGPDYFAKFSAVRSGNCLAVIPRGAIVPPFIEAKDCALPKIASKKVLLGARGDARSDLLAPIISALSVLKCASL